MTYLHATYADGFVLVEDDNDASPYDWGQNTFHAIINSRPCDEHGPLVALGLMTNDGPLNIDWTAVPPGARPVRDKHMMMQQVAGEFGTPYVHHVVFGYEYDDGGQTHRCVTEVG